MLHFLRRGKKRILAVLLSFAMIIGMLPTGTVTYAEDTVSTEGTATTWNFRGGSEGAYSGTIEAATGEFDGILIDAVLGKCASRDTGDTELTAGTKLCVPVSGSSIIIVNTSAGSHDYQINGVAADSDDFAYTYTGEEGYVEIVAQGTMYLYEINKTSAIVPTTEEVSEDNKIDVWDFGAEALDTNLYNNKLTVDIINSFYTDVDPGTKSKNLPSFSVNEGEFLFNDGGKTTHRLRTTNAALTHYDDKSLKSEDGSTIYSGYLYSNASSTNQVYLGVQLMKNDILTICVASNGGNSTINVEAPS